MAYFNLELFIRYISTYLAFLKADFSIRNLRRRRHPATNKCPTQYERISIFISYKHKFSLCVSIAVTCQTRIWKVLTSNIGWDTGYSEVSPGFPQSFQVTAGLLPRLGHGHSQICHGIAQQIWLLGYGPDYRRANVRFPTGERGVSLLHDVYTGSRAHPAYCIIGTEGDGRTVKLTTHPHLMPRSKAVELYLHSPMLLHGAMIN
jgi:hypothetical protein